VAQKHQDSEGELQPSPVPEDIARESEAPSEGDSEHCQSDYGSDAPGSQNVPAAGWLLLEYGVVHRRILTGRGRARRRLSAISIRRQAARREAERPRRLPAEQFSAELVRLRADGATYRQLAEATELSVGTVHRLVGGGTVDPATQALLAELPGYRLG
jgi:hypothetical protein